LVVCPKQGKLILAMEIPTDRKKRVKKVKIQIVKKEPPHTRLCTDCSLDLQLNVRWFLEEEFRKNNVIG
jgi:hypothetical protein